MLFEDLVEKILPFIIDEKYRKYSIPTASTKGSKEEHGYGHVKEPLHPSDTNQYLMYDFYVLDYLKFLIDKLPPKQHRDLNPEIEASVNDAQAKLFPHLREELLNAVFYALTAEMRHADSHLNNRQLFRDDPKKRKLYMDFLKYIHIKRGDIAQDDLDVLSVDEPSSKTRPPKLEKEKNDKYRNMAFKAANYSIEHNNATRKDFVEMVTEMYDKGTWNSSYGGPAWGRIGKGWLMLNASNKITPHQKQSMDSNVKPMSVAIDHVYDLQHNTDTVFNKLKSYFNPSSGYSWLKKALDHKANVKSYYDLLKHTSGTVKSMAPPVLYNRLGTTWEKHLKDSTPSTSNTKPITSPMPTPPFSANPVTGEVSVHYIFKKGQQIKCINGDNEPDITTGQVYTVVKAFPDGKLVNILNDKAKEETYTATRFKPADFQMGYSEPAKPSDPSRIKEGNVVECIDDDPMGQSSGRLPLTKGNYYTVIKVLPQAGMVRLEDDDGNENQFKISRFKKVPFKPYPQTIENARKPLEEGDPVYVMSLHGQEFHGTLTRIDKASKQGLVDFPIQKGIIGHSEWFSLSKIKKVKPAQATREQQELKVGDNAILEAGGRMYKGVVKSINKATAKAFVEFQPQHQWTETMTYWIYLSRLKKALPDLTLQDRKANPNLHIGDDVVVTGLKHTPYSGVLKDIDKTSKMGQVQLHGHQHELISPVTIWFDLKQIKPDIKI